MNLTDLNKAEQLVEKNASLRWDGWDILYLRRNPGGQYRADGIRVDNRWYTHKRIVAGPHGWKLPDRFARDL